MQSVLWILGYCFLFIPVHPQTFIHLHEWHSAYDSRFHGIAEHVPTTLKDGAPIAYTVGRRATEKANHILHVHIGADNCPYWILETPTDVKFIGLNIQSFKKSQSLSAISADDRCPQLDASSLELLFPPLIYHVKEKYSATFSAWIDDALFQQLTNIDKLKYCVALSRQAMVSI